MEGGSNESIRRPFQDQTYDGIQDMGACNNAILCSCKTPTSQG